MNTTRKAQRLREVLKEYAINPVDMRDYLQMSLKQKPCADCDPKRYELLKTEAERVVILLTVF